jgi:hypothetical protein
MPRRKPLPDPFRWFDSSPEVIRLVVMLYVKYPLSLRNVEDLLHERGIDICHETVRPWWTRFGPMFANEIRKKRVEAMRQHTRRRWWLDGLRLVTEGLSLACRELMAERSTSKSRPAPEPRRACFLDKPVATGERRTPGPWREMLGRGSAAGCHRSPAGALPFRAL